jgi:hypothetical protein
MKKNTGNEETERWMEGGVIKKGERRKVKRDMEGKEEEMDGNKEEMDGNKEEMEGKDEEMEGKEGETE